jgi:hypothetical protein
VFYTWLPPIVGSVFQVPQLWSLSFLTRGSSDALTTRVTAIAEIEADKARDIAQKEEDRKALAEAKKLGREVHAAVKARIIQERAAAADAKKQKKLQNEAERQAEKARVAAANKAKQAEIKVRI